MSKRQNTTKLTISFTHLPADADLVFIAPMHELVLRLYSQLSLVFVYIRREIYVWSCSSCLICYTSLSLSYIWGLRRGIYGGIWGIGIRGLLDMYHSLYYIWFYRVEMGKEMGKRHVAVDTFGHFEMGFSIFLCMRIAKMVTYWRLQLMFSLNLKGKGKKKIGDFW